MLLICLSNNHWIFNQYIFFSKKLIFLCINPYLIQNFSCPKKFCHHRHAVWQGIYYFPWEMAHYLRRHQETCVTFSARGEDLVLKDRRLSINYKKSTISWNVHLFNVFTEHVPVHMQDRNIKGDHFHIEGIGVPQLLRGFLNLYRWYFFNFRGFKFKMSLPSQ